MIHAQNVKYSQLMIPGTSVGSQTTVSATVSLVGWDYAEVIAQMDTGSSNVTTLQLSDADVSTYATAAEMAMTTVAGNTSTGDTYVWFLDLRKRKKLLKIEMMSSAAARIVAINVRLSRGEQAPITAAARGLTGQVIA